MRAGRPRVELTDLRGRPVVVNFWAAWCVPCAKEMPVFQRAHRRLGDRVAIVGVDNNDSRRRAVAQLKRAGVTYPSGYDPTGRVAARYKLVGMPTTIFIGADGRIRGRHAGQLSDDELRRLVRRHLGA